MLPPVGSRAVTKGAKDGDLSPRPLGTHDLWGTPGLHLPAYIQHVASHMISAGMSKGHAIAAAHQDMVHWAATSKDPRVKAAAVAALAEWEKDRAEAHARKAVDFREALHPRGYHGHWVTVGRKQFDVARLSRMHPNATQVHVELARLENERVRGRDTEALREVMSASKVKPSDIRVPDMITAMHDQLRSTRDVAKAAEHRGAMIALYPSPKTSAKLAVPDGEPAADMHVTLAYHGKAADLTNEQRSTLHTVVGNWAKKTAAPAGTITGPGKFETKNDGTAHVHLVSLPGMDDARSDLVRHLEAAGVPVSRDYSWTPHITASYGHQSSPLRASGTKLAFDTCHVVLAGEKTAYPFAPIVTKDAMTTGNDLDGAGQAPSSVTQGGKLRDTTGCPICHGKLSRGVCAEHGRVVRPRSSGKPLPK